MRFPKKKVSTRATALALVLGVVGVLVTALPAVHCPTVTASSPPSPGSRARRDVTGSEFTGVTGRHVRRERRRPFSRSRPTTTAHGDRAVRRVDRRHQRRDRRRPTPGAPRNFDVSSHHVAPTITSFTPTSGPVGTSVAITGTNLCGATQVVFNTQPVITYSVTSETSITATVPTGATTGPIRVTTPGFSQVSSAANFTVAAVPTITSFTPTSGQVGTSVTITGTNLTGVTSVKFNGVTATFSTSTATSVTATVPTAATTGTISVTTAGGTATSIAIFTVTTGPVARTVSFGFEQNSRVSGHVNVTNGTSACGSFVPVMIQKQKNGSWKWVDTTATNGNGNFKTYIPPSNGKFRAKVNKLTLANGVLCGGDASNVAHS